MHSENGLRFSLKFMNSFYKKITGLTTPKRGSGRDQFRTAVYLAKRISDGQTGILFEHQQRLRIGGARKLGANFFVPIRDLTGFLRLLNNFIINHIDELPLVKESVLKLIKPQIEEEIQQIGRDIENYESKLSNLSAKNQIEIHRLNQEISKRDEKIASITLALLNLRKQRQRVRILEFEKQIPIFKKHLADFHNLIENGVKISKKRGVQQETLFQEFLSLHHWMFGLEYISVISKPKSSTSRVPDLLLQRTDGFNDVVELENPTDPLFVNLSKRPEQSSQLKEALAQTMDYVDDYAIRHRDEFYERGIDTYKPNGILVIGRRGDKDLEKRRRQLNAYLHGIKIWTYDDLISNAEQIILLLEKGPLAMELAESVEMSLMH